MLTPMPYSPKIQVTGIDLIISLWLLIILGAVQICLRFISKFLNDYLLFNSLQRCKKITPYKLHYTYYYRRYFHTKCGGVFSWQDEMTPSHNQLVSRLSTTSYIFSEYICSVAK